MERNVGGGQHFADQASYCVGAYIQLSGFYQAIETFDGGIAIEEGFPLKLVEDIVVLAFFPIEKGDVFD